MSPSRQCRLSCAVCKHHFVSLPPSSSALPRARRWSWWCQGASALFCMARRSHSCCWSSACSPTPSSSTTSSWTSCATSARSASTTPSAGSATTRRAWAKTSLAGASWTTPHGRWSSRSRTGRAGKVWWWLGEKVLFPLSAVASFIMWVLLSVLRCRILDIEHEMTQFAFYYVGIAAAVFLLGYFQVGLLHPPPIYPQLSPHPTLVLSYTSQRPQRPDVVCSAGSLGSRVPPAFSLTRFRVRLEHEQISSLFQNFQGFYKSQFSLKWFGKWTLPSLWLFSGFLWPWETPWGLQFTSASLHL